MLARRFLIVLAAVIFLVVGARIGWELFQDRLFESYFVPTAEFRPMPGDPDYARAASWLSRPDLKADPSRYTPRGFDRPPAGPPQLAVFFVAPTASLDRTRWNVAIGDKASEQRLRIYASSEASVFNAVAQVWAPRYRQATIGAFLTDKADAAAALDFAYRDVSRAFDSFLAALPPGQPFILAGHSQGSLHLQRLMAERIANTPLSRRIVAAYLVGWPISIRADLPRMGVPACDRADQANCLVSWLSFAEPADPRLIVRRYEASRGLTGAVRRGTPPVCVNPITGSPAGAAPAERNLGGLVPRDGLKRADLVKGLVGARCDSSGLLLIGEKPSGFDPYVLPGNNFHVFDYALFWANIRADIARRAAAYALR
jgi:hypothetical protein